VWKTKERAGDITAGFDTGSILDTVIVCVFERPFSFDRINRIYRMN